jgi:hypothetical protein
MYSFRSPSTRTLWEASPEQKLYLRLTNITNQAISDIKEWWHNQTHLLFMPSFAKDVLFDANLINTLLDRNSKSCKEMAIAVNEVIEPHLGSHKFFSDIRKAVEPYLDLVVEESMGAQP